MAAGHPPQDHFITSHTDKKGSKEEKEREGRKRGGKREMMALEKHEKGEEHRFLRKDSFQYIWIEARFR